MDEARETYAEVVLRLRHGLALFAEIARYSGRNRMWWLVPAAIVVAVVVVLAGSAGTVVPFAVYTLF